MSFIATRPRAPRQHAVGDQTTSSSALPASPTRRPRAAARAPPTARARRRRTRGRSAHRPVVAARCADQRSHRACVLGDDRVTITTTVHAGETALRERRDECHVGHDVAVPVQNAPRRTWPCSRASMPSSVLSAMRTTSHGHEQERACRAAMTRRTRRGRSKAPRRRRDLVRGHAAAGERRRRGTQQRLEPRLERVERHAVRRRRAHAYPTISPRPSPPNAA